MAYHLITIILLPFLLLQGKWVRKVTPKLPEPEGPRQGISGTGPAVKVLIVGDSAAAGVGVEHQNQALLGQLVKQLSPHYQLHWSLDAETGDTTKDTLKKLAKRKMENYDFIITSLGVNDVTSPTSPAIWQYQQQKLIVALQEKYQPKQVIISQVPPMGDFPALPHPLRAFLGWKAKKFNKILAGLVATTANTALLSFESEKEHTMANDGFHPGESIYQEWAEKLGEKIREFEKY